MPVSVAKHTGERMIHEEGPWREGIRAGGRAASLQLHFRRAIRRLAGAEPQMRAVPVCHLELCGSKVALRLTERVSNNLLRLAVNIAVHQGNVVIASNHVSECRQTLLYSLHCNSLRECIANVQQLLICRRGRQ